MIGREDGSNGIQLLALSVLIDCSCFIDKEFSNQEHQIVFTSSEVARTPSLEDSHPKKHEFWSRLYLHNIPVTLVCFAF